MLFIRVLEVIVAAVIVLLIVSQVVWPALSGKRIFWLFRANEPLKDIQDARVEYEESVVDLESRKIRSETEKIKNTKVEN